ncbi:helix-turn-helix domain-containing protein [Paenibacillus sp. LMG 31461]|uniref:Helix-turn-helix domain-containing protein n=1 Tax=Paenibacillus plantarum TaxID=2654975 RepID=A0ABX1XC79_9BACL|nr:helix-turn-helix domain-containing protein [Paenibacillus plantarum]NOU65656.1 helix-turn-helix domain-containing protein [Paenibacillus plantarum]
MKMKRSITESGGHLYFVPELPLYVNRVHESFDLQQHTHDFIEISYVAEGRGSHYMDSVRMNVTKGDLFFLPVGISHVFRPASTNQNKPLIVYNCIFTQAWMDQLLRHAAAMGEQEIPQFFQKATDSSGGVEFLSFHEQNGEFQPLFEQLHFEFKARRAGFITVMQACVEQLFVYMHRAKFDRLPQVPQTSMNSIEHLLTHIRMNCSNPITLVEAASKLSLSERQLQRQLRKLTGMSFTTYVQHARLEACCQYLRESTYKISDIAALVGYQDMKFFNQLFKKMIGVTPRQYRQQQAERKKPLTSIE